MLRLINKHYLYFCSIPCLSTHNKWTFLEAGILPSAGMLYKLP